jgi:hypothetical protein
VRPAPGGPRWAEGPQGQPGTAAQYAYRWEGGPSPCSSSQFTVVTFSGSSQVDTVGFSIAVP